MIDVKLYIEKQIQPYEAPSWKNGRTWIDFIMDYSMLAQIFFTGAILFVSWYALYKIPKSGPTFAAFITGILQKLLKIQ